ncbi:MAG: hypothetical protein HOE92_01160 [Euryarchaeota archaeon]|nr:hypothetical protein [Euryarchaeota archaeon]MBT4407319.1 hypothetical protein [Euryarchaeota archaeon]
MSSTGWAKFAYLFGEYYRTSDFWLPPRLRMREWMFIPFGGGTPLRHRAFDDASRLRQFLLRSPPHSAFYSTAYWRKPREYKMVEKEWKGADLIFDLDGDHLPGISDVDFEGMLIAIREQAHRLWNDFLEPEFGFDKKFLQVTFSGHRGYHLHYRDPTIVHLDSEARRELVAHIRGEGIDVGVALEEWQNPDASGWTKRLREGLNQTLQRLDTVREGERKQAKPVIDEMIESMRRSAILSGKSIKRGPTVVEKIAELIEHPERRRRLLNGNWNALGGKQRGDPNFYRNALIDIVRSDRGIVLGGAGETDEVVTVDTRRVIRWPTSLHGKCGLRVSEFPLDRLDPDGSNPFDPLTEAIALPMSKSIKVETTIEHASTRVGEYSIDTNCGDMLELPEGVAAFLVLKGWAKLAPSA